MASAKKSEEEESKLREKLSATIMASLKVVFVEADADDSGDLDQDELRVMLRQPHVRERLELLQLPPRDLDLLFTLLDNYGTGSVPTDQFFRGCARMKGPAKACDLHQLSIDLSRNIYSYGAADDSVRDVNNRMVGLLNMVDEVDREIVKGSDDAKDPVLQSRRACVRLKRTEKHKHPKDGEGAQESAPTNNEGASKADRAGSKKSRNSLIGAEVRAMNHKMEREQNGGERRDSKKFQTDASGKEVVVPRSTNNGDKPRKTRQGKFQWDS